jgi:hypothetical protein
VISARSSPSLRATADSIFNKGFRTVRSHLNPNLAGSATLDDACARPEINALHREEAWRNVVRYLRYGLLPNLLIVEFTNNEVVVDVVFLPAFIRCSAIPYLH